MIKLLHLELHDTCEECPYYDARWNSCREYDREIEIDEVKGVVFPDWCPLQTWVDGDKF